MIIEKESEIKVLRTLCGSPFDYFSVAEISRNTGISRNWTYKVIAKFERNRILSVSGKRHKLDFGRLFCKQLKLLFDAESLNSLDSELESKIFSIANRIIFKISPRSVVLVGSVAADKQKKESDIDFLVISEKKEVPYFEDCNMVVLTPDELNEKYLKGDDFIISALLFGKVVYDNNFFIKLFEKPLPIFSQELIQEKIQYCSRLEERVYTLLKTDEAKAREELLYLALQAARIILLNNKIVPRTKHDIAGQVNKFNSKLSSIIKDLLKKKNIGRDKMLNHVKIAMGVAR